MVTWLVEADTTRDSTYVADITTYVIGMNWSHGFQSQDDNVAPPARLTLTLDNTGGQFLPETLFSERLTNGNFTTWSGGNPSSWTVSSESAGTREISQTGRDKSFGGGGTGACNIYNTTSTAISITQSVLTVNLGYRVQISITNVRRGGIIITAGGRQVGPLLTKTGIYTFYTRAAGTDFKIESFRIDGVCDVTIDDVSVMQTSRHGRLLVPGTQVRVKANGTTMFIGSVAAENGTSVTINNRSGSVMDQTMTLTVEDYMLKLLDAEYAPPLLTDTTTGAVLQRMADDGVIIAPYPADYAMLDVQGSMELNGTKTKLWDSSTLFAIDTGDTALDFAGDSADKGKGVSAQGYIREMVDAEAGGRFYYNARTGKFTFKERSSYVYQGTLADTFDESEIIGAEYISADQMFNQITVNYSDREIGEPATVLWTSKDVPFKLGRGARRTFNVRYTTTSSEKTRIAGKDFILPFAGLDYTANSAENNSGEDKTGLITMSAECNAMSAKIYVENASREEVWVQHMQIRGTPLITYDVSYETRDGDAMALYGTLPRTVSVKALSDRDFVEQYANWLMSKYKAPLARFSSITLNALTPSTNETIAISRTIGDFIRITNSYADHDQTYVIIGENHSVSAGPERLWQVTYYLALTNRDRYTLLGVAGTNELDTTARLGL